MRRTVVWEDLHNEILFNKSGVTDKWQNNINDDNNNNSINAQGGQTVGFNDSTSQVCQQTKKNEAVQDKLVQLFENQSCISVNLDGSLQQQYPLSVSNMSRKKGARFLRRQECIAQYLRQNICRSDSGPERSVSSIIQSVLFEQQ